MAEKKKATLGASVPPPSEKADFFAQLQNTFERGVVSAEVDLTGLFGKEGGGGSVVTMYGEADRTTTGPAGVTDQTIRRMKDVANTFGGKFTVHGPMQANPADLLGVGRAEAAGILQKSLDYTEKLGGKLLNIHPIGQMEYYFIDPFMGTKQPVNNPFYLAKDPGELEGLMNKFGVKDPLLKKQIEKEWRNWVMVIPTMFAQRFGSMAVRYLDNFARYAAESNVGALARKYRNDPRTLEREINLLAGKVHPTVGSNMKMIRSQLVPNGTINKKLADRLILNADENEGNAAELWPKVMMSSLDPIGKDGTIVKTSERLIELGRRQDSLSDNELREFDQLRQDHYSDREELRLEAWKRVLGDERGRLGPFKESEEQMMVAVEDTFDRLFDGIKKEGGRTFKALKQGKIKIAFENLFPASPEHGYMQGFAYFYEPKHMAELVKLIRKKAKEKGFPPDIITLTVDIAHAAASQNVTKMTPSQFLKELKKEGVPAEHVHLVGGPGYGHGHIAWGDWLDEVSRMDPDVVKRLMDVGVINIEGGAGVHDIEVTLNALWDKGLPLEAMLAMAGAPDRFTPDLTRYTGFAPSAYMEGVASSYVGTAMPQRAFYSFQYETVPLPMRGAFGGYSAPGLFGGGYAIGPTRTPSVWPTAQPFLYSAKREE